MTTDVKAQLERLVAGEWREYRQARECSFRPALVQQLTESTRILDACSDEDRHRSPEVPRYFRLRRLLDRLGRVEQEARDLGEWAAGVEAMTPERFDRHMRLSDPRRLDGPVRLLLAWNLILTIALLAHCLA